ncbi:MAG: Gfo/Idh/MocA family oxidoreductase [Magnetococcales bacterium]|nr:Gfo/Idh/MocA family oxidoreductase [Magnetococcales bacterium]
MTQSPRPATAPPVRAAIIGCGLIAGLFLEKEKITASPITTHGAALSASPAFTLDAISDIDTERLQRFQNLFAVPHAFDRWEKLIAERRPELVVIATPDATHADLTEKLVRTAYAPRLIILEKPLCATPAERLRLARLLIETPPVQVVVNHSGRFNARYLQIRDLIADNRLGPVVSVRWVYYGGWVHNGVHVIDNLRLFLGGSLTIRDVRPGWRDRAGDPCLELSLASDRFPHARIEIESFPESAYQLFEAEIRLEQGRIRLADFGQEITVDEVRTNAAGERELKVSTPLITTGSTPMLELYRLVADHFATASGLLLETAGANTVQSTMELIHDAQIHLAGHPWGPTTPHETVD